MWIQGLKKLLIGKKWILLIHIYKNSIKIIIFTLVLLLSACESNQIYQKAQYKANITDKYPVVSIV
jgi:hypothetical protein